ncbi:hypothetical protein SERLA73DRAFT_115219 [Serpula lacrymans var. lacrymans S7.3]|uniref:GST N-terminal domain-containing protein n=2 Tax=Serpula lacrymans var. lacrymans TaxID=341189 RepID=F8QCC7_SERL3|nr:uncharacterized protein SERLADRAFT_453680 [Serpula lacrymans var. lacrymans S7.9]EGN93792.1 hypothetical protein SERLA73DRAFT_115219 [Serpula lacrymans var. lacrymans S7.3]EGO19163.1 hypothetical protein SERLADRAFT_453680 [Serpula lacrymans var. lacrymans S7.9]
MAQPIILYDVPSSLPGKAWSPNMHKARWALSYKGVPFETVWIEYSDIQTRMKSIGAQPTTKTKDGNDLYTLPVIQDPSTGAIVSDSFIIAEYLDKTYPSLPTLFPSSSKALIYVLDKTFTANGFPLVNMMLLKVVPHLLSPTKEYFVSRREYDLGLKMEEWSPVGPKREEHWDHLKQSLDVVEGWYARTPGPWIMGDTFSHADIIIGARLEWYYTILDEDERKKLTSWHEGRWAKLLTEVGKVCNVL